MWEICANSLLPKALKPCSNSNKSPNLVTLRLRLINLTTQVSHFVTQVEHEKVLLNITTSGDKNKFWKS